MTMNNKNIRNGVPVKIGDKYFELTVIEMAQKNKRGEQCWKCLCGCGKNTILVGSAIGINRTCGCSHFRLGNKSCHFKGYGEIYSSLWTSIQIGARERNLEFNITIEDAWNLFIKQNRKCVLSGEILTFRSKSEIADGTASLDRIDSSKGYTIDNIQWIHKDLNFAKQKLSQHEFINLCKKVAYFNNNECITKLGPSHKDERGNIQMILEKCECKSVSVITSKPNTTRATHWHKLDFHYCIVSRGQIYYYERPVGSVEKPTLTIVKEGELFYTPPRAEHEMFFPIDTEFYCFSGLDRKSEHYESDTVRLPEKLRNIYNNWKD